MSLKHRGWKAIAIAVECSIRTAQELARPRENGRLPLPLERDHVGIFVESERLELWLKLEREPFLKYLERTAAVRATRPPAHQRASVRDGARRCASDR